MAARPGGRPEPEIIAANVSRTCSLAFSVTSSGSARALAAPIYVLSCCMIGLTSCGGLSKRRDEAAFARPSGSAARIVDRPLSLINWRRATIARPFPSCKCSSAWLISILYGFSQCFHDSKQFTFGFKADSWNFREADITVLHGNAIRESAERLEDSWVGFVASES